MKAQIRTTPLANEPSARFRRCDIVLVAKESPSESDTYR